MKQKTAAKIWLLSLKNKLGIFEPAAVGAFNSLVPLAFGRVSKFQVLPRRELKEICKFYSLKEVK